MKHLLPALLLVTLPLTAASDSPGAPTAHGQEAAAPLPPPAHRPQQARAFRLPGREQIAMRMMVRQLLLDRYDADGNLELSGEEHRRLMEDAEAARKQQALAFIRQFDANGDGSLSPEERATMQQAVESRRSQARGEQGTQPPMPQAELPADAPQIPGAEPPAPPRRHTEKRGPHGRRHQARPPHPHMGKEGRKVAFMVRQLTMDAYDTDKDGILDTTESARLREDGERLYQAREAELLARYDADQDGKLSETELQAAMHALRPRRSPRQQHAPAPGAEEKPAPPHRGRAQGPIHRLLDTRFDIDILRLLAHPQGAEDTTPPCAPSTPSAN